MKLLAIFEHRLYAFQYADEKEHELRRLLGLWNDLGYLHAFVKKAKADLPKDVSVMEWCVNSWNKPRNWMNS